MHFCDEPSRCCQAGPYVDILDLVDEFRLGPAGCVHLCTSGLCDIDVPPVLTLDYLGLTVQLVHMWEDLCEVHPGCL